VKQLLKGSPSVLELPLIETILPSIRKWKKLSHRYRRLPNWYLFKEEAGGEDLLMERSREWDRLMGQIEQAHS
jgi:hypothetical protein